MWIAGAIRRTYRYLKEVRRFCRICEYNEEIEQEHLKEYFEHICKRQHIYKEVTVYANSRIQVPVIFGVLKRTILLPASCSTPEELQIILEHEMIHAKHNDLLMERIAAVLHLVLWFLPEPKQLLDKLEEWSETICDISVCASEDSVWNKKQYFTLLLHWAQEEKAAGSGAVLALSGESSGIRTRIMRMHRYEQAGSGRLNRNLSSGLWLTGCCICIILGIVFGIQKMGQSISAQVYTAHLLEQTGIGSGVRNSDIRLKGSCVVAEGKENKHLLYLKEGEHICVYYDADLYDADAASEMDKEVFGMVGMEAVLGDVTMECPGILGQDTAGFAVNESGWYLFTVKNHFEGQDIGIDYIIVKG